MSDNPTAPQNLTAMVRQPLLAVEGDATTTGFDLLIVGSLLSSLILQVIAAWLAARLAWQTQRLSWLWLALAIIVFGLRRWYLAAIALSASVRVDLHGDAIMLLISALLVIGIGGLYRSVCSAQGADRRLDPLGLVTGQSRLTRMALAIGGFSVVTGAGVGFLAYESSYRTLFRQLSQSNLDLARTYSQFVAHIGRDLSRRELLEELEQFWRRSASALPGSFLCVVGENGCVAAHTDRPELVGRHVGDMRLSFGDDAGAIAIHSLLAGRADATGTFRGLDNRSQVAAFAFNRQIPGLIAVHVPLEVVRAAVKEGALPWAVGFGVLSAVLLPLALGLMHWAFTASQKALGQSQLALLESEQRYRELFENANAVVYTHDLHGDFTSVNRLGEQLLGYSRDEVLRMNIASLIVPEELARARAMIEQKIEGAPATDYEIEVLSKSGRRLRLEVSTRLVYVDGKPAAVQGIARDVTERATTEERVRQGQKLEAIGRLAGGVAHDFNNVLTAISGCSQLALMRLDSQTVVRQMLEQVLQAADRAASLTRQLLTFSRREPMQPQVLDLNVVVREIDEMLRRLIGEDIGLTIEMAPVPALVWADRGQMEQVLINLVVNSRDAMPLGGSVTIRTEHVVLPVAPDSNGGRAKGGPAVLLEVRDTGCGMDEETRARIFEPFFTTKAPDKGTGLGLSTVYGIVRQSEGEIRVETAVGRGTTFRVILAAANGVERTAPGTSTDHPIHGGAETVLVVEDQDDVRTMVCEALRHYGYQVLDAAGPNDAVEIWKRTSGNVDLLLTDVVMPDGGGRQLAATLARLQPDLRVLYMSGYTDDALVHNGELDPETNFLRKPFSPPALARRVRTLLDAS